MWAWFALLAWAAPPQETIEAAFARLEAGDEQGAVELLQGVLPELEAAVATEPENAEAHFLLGQARYALREDAQAQSSWERALELQPTHEGALYSLALLLGDQLQWPAAAAMWGRLVAARPDHPEARWNEGQSLQLAGEVAQARVVFEDIVQKQPAEWRALSKVAQLAQAQGDLAGRDAALERLRALRAGGTVPELAQTEVFVRDQFDQPDKNLRIMALEHFELEGDMARLYVFVLLDAPSGQEVGTISLGSYDATTAFARETGQIGPEDRMYHLDGYWPDGSHMTFGFFPQRPTYDEIRAQVVAILQGTQSPVSATMPAQETPEEPPNKKEKKEKKKEKKKKGG